ncbi:MAG TPA: glycosyltransferase [Frankiaceae bacterium]|jgi:glycosyltransferase involved in cell wall biosynthesis|nr:glycosyltransferase [Frankiaceae bacterium]
MLRRPRLAYRLVLRLARSWTRLVRRRLADRSRYDAVLVGYLGHFDVLLARLLYPRRRIALDQMIFAADTARDRGVSGGAKLRLLDVLDRLAVRAASVVLLDTAEHVDLLPAGERNKGVVVPVGAPASWFTAGEQRPAPTSGRLRVAFFGLYTPLQGAVVIGEALARLAGHPEVAVTMIGKGQDLEETRRAAAGNESVTWLEWVPSEDLPAVVASHDVCLGIFGLTPKALRVVPNKVYQGAAAGCVIVTSDTPPQRRMLAGAALYVPPGDPQALADALLALAADPARAAALGAAAREAAQERFTPAAIVEPLRTRLS